MNANILTPISDMPEWEIDCMNYYEEVLTGEYAHWCPEWDDMPIDETRKEFEACLCFTDNKEVTQ